MGKLQYSILGLAIVLVGVLFFIVSKVSHSSSALPVSPQKHVVLTIHKNKLISGPDPITVTEGEIVTITIFADKTEELHLHGYNKMIELSASSPAVLRFVANLTGHFEYELEQEKVTIGALDVLPK